MNRLNTADGLPLATDTTFTIRADGDGTTVTVRQRNRIRGVTWNTVHINLPQTSGFTLIEIVITIVILGAVAGILVPFINAIVHSPDPVIRERAISLGQAMMDEIMAKDGMRITPMGGGPICTGESSSKVTRPTLVDDCATPRARNASVIDADGEIQRPTYDDVDDYNGIIEIRQLHGPERGRLYP